MNGSCGSFGSCDVKAPGERRRQCTRQPPASGLAAPARAWHRPRLCGSVSITDSEWVRAIFTRPHFFDLANTSGKDRVAKEIGWIVLHLALKIAFFHFSQQLPRCLDE